MTASIFATRKKIGAKIYLKIMQKENGGLIRQRKKNLRNILLRELCV